MDYFTHTAAQPKHILIFCHIGQVFVAVVYSGMGLKSEKKLPVSLKYPKR